MSKKNIRQYNQTKLQEALSEFNEPKYRINQLYDWLWQKSAVSFNDMTNLPKSFREQLNTFFEILPAKTHLVQKSNDGTIKTGFKLFDERLVEGVLIPTETRNTACVSSQVGCALSCDFCATGFLKRERNLDPGEIYDQVVILNNLAKEHYNKPLTNIVFMGMGEPLLNFDNVMLAIEKITSPKGLHMSPKRITLSTVGVSRGIDKLSELGVKFNLAWSLHAPTNEKRAQIMDINKSNPIEQVIESLQKFYDATGNKITFEYILFNNFNDTKEDALNLVKLCKQVPSFVNIIEYNNVEGVELTKAKRQNRENFVAILEKNRVNVKVRMSRGKDIDAACGQLANKNS